MYDNFSTRNWKEVVATQSSEGVVIGHPAACGTQQDANSTSRVELLDIHHRIPVPTVPTNLLSPSFLQNTPMNSQHPSFITI